MARESLLLLFLIVGFPLSLLLINCITTLSNARKFDPCKHANKDTMVRFLYRYLRTFKFIWGFTALHVTPLNIYRVSHNWVFTLFWLFFQLPELIQRNILLFFNSPADDDSKTHLTFLSMSKIVDQVTEQNVRQTGFRYNLDKPCMYQKNI